MKPLILDGITYDKQYVRGLCQPLLAVRDCLMGSEHLPYAAALSQIHAVLQHYIEELDSKSIKEKSLEAATKLKEEYEIGKASRFCDDPPDFDPADTEQIARIIEQVFNNEETKT